MEEQSRFLLELRQYLIRRWNDFQLQGSPAGIAYRLRHSPKGRILEESRFVALWFTDNPERPQVVTKWVLKKDLFIFIQKEYEHTRWLHENRSCRFVPKPLGCPEISGFPVLIEEAVPGRSLAHLLIGLQFESRDAETEQRVFSEVFAKAGEVLSKLQDPLKPVSKKMILEKLLDDFSRTKNVLGWEENHSEKIWRVLSDYPLDPIEGSGEALLIGDFAPQNILSKKGTSTDAVYLIDLEFSRKSLLAFLDPFSFLYSLFRFMLERGEEKDSNQILKLFEQIFLEGEEIFGTSARNFLVSRGIPIEHLAWYWLVFFLHQTSFQESVSENFPVSLQKFFDGLIDFLLNRFFHRFSN